MDIMVFKRRLKEARRKAGLRQNDLANRSGVTGASISSYESTDGKNGMNPTLVNAALMAKTLGVSLDWLCGLETKNDSEQDDLKIGKSLLHLFKSGEIQTAVVAGKETLIFTDSSGIYLKFFQEIQNIQEISALTQPEQWMVDVLTENALEKFKNRKEQHHD